MSLKRNTFYNLIGMVLPLAISILVVPYYLTRIGEARYGVMALVWLSLGYFGLFDFGLSTATTNAIAKSSDPDRTTTIFWTVLIANFILGIIGAVILLFIGLALDYRTIIPGALTDELSRSLLWIALSVPLVTINGVFTGSMAARSRFFELNSINAIGSILFQIVPLVVALIYSPNLDVIIPAAILARAATVTVCGLLSMHILPAGPFSFDLKALSGLFKYGGWILVSNAISPILLSIDRLAIGMMIGPSAVAQYSVPFSLASRAAVLPSALSQSLFPVLSSYNLSDAAELAGRSVKTLCVLMTALCAPAIVLATPLMSLWLGHRFASHSAPIAKLLLLGVWINGLAYIPYTLLQAMGRPRIIAWFHTLELAPFLALLVLSISFFGLPGAAIAWSARTFFDALLLFWTSGLGGKLLRPALSGATILAVAWAVSEAKLAGVVAPVICATAIGGATLSWGYLTDSAIRRVARGLLSGVRRNLPHAG